MSIITAIISFIANGLTPFFAWLTAKDNAARDEALAQLNAWVAALNTITQFKAVQFGWIGTRILFFGFALGPLVHSFLVYADSCGQFLFWWPHQPGSWHIVVPPAPFDNLEKLIILSFFATTVTGGILNTVQRGLQLNHERALIMAGKEDLLPQRRAAALLAATRDPKRRVTGTSTPPIIWLALGLVIIVAIVAAIWAIF